MSVSSYLLCMIFGAILPTSKRGKAVETVCVKYIVCCPPGVPTCGGTSATAALSCSQSSRLVHRSEAPLNLGLGHAMNQQLAPTSTPSPPQQKEGLSYTGTESWFHRSPLKITRSPSLAPLQPDQTCCTPSIRRRLESCMTWRSAHPGRCEEPWVSRQHEMFPADSGCRIFQLAFRGSPPVFPRLNRSVSAYRRADGIDSSGKRGSEVGVLVCRAGRYRFIVLLTRKTRWNNTKMSTSQQPEMVRRPSVGARTKVRWDVLS